jgi:hypothetical protein
MNVREQPLHSSSGDRVSARGSVTGTVPVASRGLPNIYDMLTLKAGADDAKAQELMRRAEKACLVAILCAANDTSKSR